MSARRQRAPVRVRTGIKMLRDFGERVDASEERQIVRRDPPQHEAIVAPRIAGRDLETGTT